MRLVRLRPESYHKPGWIHSSYKHTMPPASYNIRRLGSHYIPAKNEALAPSLIATINSFSLSNFATSKITVYL